MRRPILPSLVDYAHVSTERRDTATHAAALKEAGCEPNDKVSYDGSRGVVFPDPVAKGFVDPSLPSATVYFEVIDHVAGKTDGG